MHTMRSRSWQLCAPDVRQMPRRVPCAALPVAAPAGPKQLHHRRRRKGQLCKRAARACPHATTTLSLRRCLTPTLSVRRCLTTTLSQYVAVSISVTVSISVAVSALASPPVVRRPPRTHHTTLLRRCLRVTHALTCPAGVVHRMEVSEIQESSSQGERPMLTAGCVSAMPNP